MPINFPDNPSVNDEFQAQGRTWIWNGTSWDAVIGTSSAGKFISSTNAPENAQQGQGWFDPNSAQFFIYYDNAWIEVGPQLVGPVGATGPAGLDSTVPGPTGPAGTNGTNGIDGGFNTAQVVENKSSNYTLQSSDAGKLMTNSAAITITVQGLSVGQQVDFFQNNAGQITFSAGAGITIVSKDSKNKTSGIYSPASIKCLSSNTYALVGDIA